MNWFLYLGGIALSFGLGLRICGIKFRLSERVLDSTWFVLFSVISYPIAGLSGVSVWIWICWRISQW